MRVVNNTTDKMNISPLPENYKGGGSRAFHPVMLPKVLLYAYSVKIYSGRKTEKELRENINFMWLSGNNRPDFRAINMFRSGRFRNVTESIFCSETVLPAAGKYTDLSRYFADGTKLQADAGRHSYVWKKNADRNREGVENKIKELFRQTDEINRAEESQYGNKNPRESPERKAG